MAADNSESRENIDEKLLNLRWMIRLCDTYEDEYSDCTSIKTRFHQYFVHGQTLDCNDWKRDLENCKRWRDDNNAKAFKELIESETNRRQKRLTPHYQNDTWKKRTGPPPDWNKPLPAWLEAENKGTFLQLKADEIKTHGMQKEPERTLCIIS